MVLHPAPPSATVHRGRSCVCAVFEGLTHEGPCFVPPACSFVSLLLARPVHPKGGGLAYALHQITHIKGCHIKQQISTRKWMEQLHGAYSLSHMLPAQKLNLSNAGPRPPGARAWPFSTSCTTSVIV